MGRAKDKARVEAEDEMERQQGVDPAAYQPDMSDEPDVSDAEKDQQFAESPGAEEELCKYEVMQNHTIISGSMYDQGTIVELAPSVAKNHQEHGIPLRKVEDKHEDESV